ncbi:DUF305 domain-containing protein [Acetobacteraceae bacterium KSS8]|uniref:DUF305 domain-containing protein n=1 Tax=Endosaccharibacter trunci TaxID=2812733 RepID=A0ABT1W661_9PROT|nr:DUF305 domain-containing protein [Acetobacteraceae bacterium KSS8]
MPRFPFRPGASLVLLLGMAGTAMANPGMNGMGNMVPGSADEQMREGMQHMQQDMQGAVMTGDPDHDFVVMMLPHHIGAVDMAKVELAHGQDPALLKLARGIVAAQDREIAFMKAWLAKHPADKPMAGAAMGGQTMATH